MGFGWQELLIILIIVALIFGTKKLRNIGSDLGGAVKGFKDSVTKEGEEEKEEAKTTEQLSDESTQTENLTEAAEATKESEATK